MKKRKPIGKVNFEVKTSMFRRNVHVFLNYTHPEFAAEMRKRGIPYEDDPNYDKDFAAFSSSFSAPKGGTQWVICVRNFDWCIDDQVSLIHEIVHTIIKTWDLNNVPMDTHTQEFAASEIADLYGAIAHDIFHKINPKKK